MMGAPPPAPLTLRETRRRLRVDRGRLLECLRSNAAAPGLAALHPSYVAVALYRYSRWCYVRGWRLSARFLWQLNISLTGADISPLSELGEGLLIVHPYAVTISGSAGRNLCVEGLGGMGTLGSLDEIGAGPGLPLLGDDVRMDRGAMVLGPVRIGHRVHIGPGCTVTHDVADDCEVQARAPRIRHGASTEDSPDAPA